VYKEIRVLLKTKEKLLAIFRKNILFGLRLTSLSRVIYMSMQQQSYYDKFHLDERERNEG